MAFSFGFSGDDIDIDDSETTSNVQNVQGPPARSNSLPELVKASRHSIDEWLSVLPSQISFNRLSIGSTPLVIARRELFDIRTQLMAEDNAGQDNAELISGLDEGDLKPNFYEGGFKTWECSLDLAKLVADEPLVNDVQTNLHIIELGAGTAVPTLTVLAKLLTRSEPTEASPTRKTLLTFADYNDSVLRLVTLPNIILTWYGSRTWPTAQVSMEGATQDQSEQELDITSELISEFKADLARRGITINFISGAWSPEFVDMVFSAQDSEYQTLLLASETIYSPSSLRAFSETLVSLLRGSGTASAKSRALIAAKKVYFGVGGGVDEFLSVLKDVSGDLEIQQKLDVQSEGVGRVVLGVKPPLL
ncbi:hypothetical protein N7468_001987 [Penicillium chermesinum]|uniref:protein-histidine N-methyltransferase n=1 Tax=Penicillium chermesinum TaxID=63820 RepID=A0A9W9PHW5_9EURO|nr:uncharacterized protein N7468_001987 [Penicillium chermesinum]KAJ5247004.1 hypothetical protein N7468_001987 [Penicillium chermesinum]KAJ6145255.1 hypothetical protein N7470_009150 [Penicillium chermesinum]